jgi:hypothetical protein
MEEFHEVRESHENASPLEDLKSQIQTQTVTIKTLKVLLDQYKQEINRLHNSNSSSCTENIPPGNREFKLEPDGLDVKLALQVCVINVL